MYKQLTFSTFNNELAKTTTTKKSFLERIEKIIPWSK